ncbi:unnamed protein product [Rotaria sp. Silwood2]|nr:unnamed protein product [Rotaria sp. Silwood2]CAF3591656.1 unnamed protein product [Rotaria sp. Silwood2]CAF4535824.1 unnamed protein product [Rotaria sp. Silwood2]CAF4565195.1 unnamed protein product [Rotaria sp. Silwood2]CAF4832197.1 unnamed protein product [Rotaria sp. Silwood2]
MQMTYQTPIYTCATKTFAYGYCILGWSDAVALCNSDPNCGGFSLTTNRNWHNAFDTASQAAVSLFSAPTGAPTPTPGEWYPFFKKCWQFNTQKYETV